MLKWKLLMYLSKRKKIGKHIQDAEILAEELQKYLWLYEKGNKGYKDRAHKENACRTVEQFLWSPMNLSPMELKRAFKFKIKEQLTNSFAWIKLLIILKFSLLIKSLKSEHPIIVFPHVFPEFKTTGNKKTKKDA